MKTTIKQLAAAMLILLAAATAEARPIVLPDPATGGSETGTFSVSADNKITLTGNRVTLTTSLPSNGDIASGSARFMSGDLQYNDGTSFSSKSFVLLVIMKVSLQRIHVGGYIPIQSGNIRHESAIPSSLAQL